MRILFSFCLLIFSIHLVAQTHIRLNQAGYTPKRNKVAIVMSNVKLTSSWQINKGETLIKTGEIGGSKTGKGKHMPYNYNYEIDFSDLETVGDYTIRVGEVIQPFKISEDPYAKLPNEIIRYFRVQRSGTADCLDHNAGHVSDSSIRVYRRVGSDNKNWKKDTTDLRANLQGGWYDAGDYLKFTLTTAYASYMILRAYEANPDLFQDKNYSKTKWNDALDEANWGLQYVSKCLVDSNTFIVQVGNQMDHEVGNRLPDQDKVADIRKAYASMSRTQMGYSAAALALGARIFKQEGDSVLSEKYLKQAKLLYRLARKSRESPAYYAYEHGAFYDDKTKHDNMQIAAFELYKSTGTDEYFDQAKSYADFAGLGGWYSWADANVIAHASMSKVHKRCGGYADADLSMFNSIASQENNLWGVPHEYTWATLYSFFGVANGSILYHQNFGSDSYANIAYDVIDYTFGRNNWGVSFIVSKKLPNSVENIYSQTYVLQPELYPLGAIAEGPGDRKSHEELKQYYGFSDENHPMNEFNTENVIFYDEETDFQTMETTIAGLGDGLLLLSLMSKHLK